ncbi:hypothetical protein [Streptomyces sp. NPDC058629]|uniref:hypothetical protein n=1 Tax=Streptomyces sp. NPDC058629 TaxID=3346565 RepID=UPI0036465EFA
MAEVLDFIQVATSGAAAMVAEMAKASWDPFRRGIARWFGDHAGTESVEGDLQVIDEARARLTECPESERDAVAEELRQELFIQLAAFLRKHPTAAVELQELVEGSDSADEGRQARTSVHHNTNSQVVVTGGSLRAGGSIVYRGPGGAQ